MSEKKPGFFKRLLGSLMGTPEETPPAPEEKPAAAPEPKPGKAEKAEKPKAPAKPKAPSKPKEPAKPKEAAKAKAAAKPKEAAKAKAPATEKARAAKAPARAPQKKEPATAKSAKKPAAKAAPKTSEKPKAPAAPKAGTKPKAETKPAKPEAEDKAPARKVQAKPAPETETRAEPVPAPEAERPAREPEPTPEAPGEEKKRRSLSDLFFGGKEEAAQPEKAPEPEELPEPEPEPEPRIEAEIEPEPEPLPEPAAEAPSPAPSPEPEPEPARKGWFARLRDGLSKTSNALTDNITTIFTKRRLDDETLQELEDALIQADLGVEMAIQIAEEVAKGRYNKEIAPEEVRAVLGAEVAGVLEPVAKPLELDTTKAPHVVLVVGVNGTGKTTTIGKLSNRFAREGKKVVLAAGDTFRAAAIEQLQIWGERTGAPVVARQVGADAAGLAFDALQKAREEKADVLLIDTAGRLQNKKDLMDELAKVVRVIKKLDPSAPHSVLLVLDATTGQNAMRQVEVFQEIAGVTGLIMTKLDGTARGGILVAIAKKFALPVHAIGVGESVEDLQPFDAFEFASVIAGAQEKVEADA